MQLNENEEMEVCATAKEGDIDSEDIREPTIMDLASILQAFMGQQETRDKKRK